jgi:allophanate hydrolase subunit 2
MSGIGPAALAGGTVLPVGAPGPAHIVGATEPTPLAQPKDGITTLRMILGPHADWFSAATIERFCRQYWHATEQSNRIGVRLMYDANDNEAGRLERCRGGELATEGMLPGAVQVPPEGLPIIFLKDHPVTGGYPVIAVVIAEDLPRAAQIAPGEALRFVAVAPDTLRPLAADADPTATPKTLPCKKS